MCDLLFFNGKVLSVDPPSFAELLVREREGAGVEGAGLTTKMAGNFCADTWQLCFVKNLHVLTCVLPPCTCRSPPAHPVSRATQCQVRPVWHGRLHALSRLLLVNNTHSEARHSHSESRWVHTPA